MIKTTLSNNTLLKSSFPASQLTIDNSYAQKSRSDKGYLSELPDSFQQLFDRFAALAQTTEPGSWYEKGAETSFKYEGRSYLLTPSRLYTYNEIFAILDGQIERELQALGATDLAYWGMLD